MNPLEAGRRLGEMAAREQREGNFRAAARLYMHAVLALTALTAEHRPAKEAGEALEAARLSSRSEAA